MQQKNTMLQIFVEHQVFANGTDHSLETKSKQYEKRVGI